MEVSFVNYHYHDGKERFNVVVDLWANLVTVQMNVLRCFEPHKQRYTRSQIQQWTIYLRPITSRLAQVRPSWPSGKIILTRIRFLNDWLQFPSHFHLHLKGLTRVVPVSNNGVGVSNGAKKTTEIWMPPTISVLSIFSSCSILNFLHFSFIVDPACDCFLSFFLSS